MTSTTLRTVHDGLADARAFADRHPEIRSFLSYHLVSANVVPINGVKVIVVPVVGAPDPRKALTEIVTCALDDGIPVSIDAGGKFLTARLGFGDLAVGVFDYQTTYAEDSALYALVDSHTAVSA